MNGKGAVDQKGVRVTVTTGCGSFAAVETALRAGSREGLARARECVAGENERASHLRELCERGETAAADELPALCREALESLQALRREAPLASHQTRVTVWASDGGRDLRLQRETGSVPTNARPSEAEDTRIGLLLSAKD